MQWIWSGLVLALCQAAPAAQGGRHLGVYPGPDAPSQCGFSVDGVGDLDGDGFDEVIAGAPESKGTQQFGSWVGRIMIVAGRDGRALFEAEGKHNAARLGWAVRGLDDLDGDGVREFAAGAPYDNANGYRAGVVYVWSGKTRSILHTLKGNAGDFMGVSIARAGDIDGDGVGDILTGGHGGETRNQGVVLVWSGKTGTLLKRLVGLSAYDFFGHAIGGDVDLNGDGTPDILVGVPDEDTAGSNAGVIMAYSGKDYTLLWSELGDGATDNFGHSICVVGDLDGDRVEDIAVGAPQFTPTNLGTGYLRVLSGKTGKSIRRWAGANAGDWFSEPVSRVGDWNGDGTADVLVGSSRASIGSLSQAGRTDILSGKDGSILQSWTGKSSGDLFGFAAMFAGDTNHDGQDDLVFGAPGASGLRGLVQIDTRTPPELTIGINQVSISQLNDAHMQANLAPKFGGMVYYTIGSVSGRSPGIRVGSVTIPLKADFYTDVLLTSPNTFVQNGFGLVPHDGRIHLSFGLAAGFSPSLAGLRIDHAMLVIDTNKLSFEHATNAVTLRLVK